MDEVLSLLEEDIELLGDSVEERKTKADIAKLLELLKEQEGYVSVPFSWLVKFCSHIDFNEPMYDSEREQAWKEKLKQQFGIDV